MFKFLPSRDPSTIVVEIDGKATGKDAQALDEYVEKHYGDKEPFHVLAIIQELDGSTAKGLLKGPEFDAKRWDQFKKFAIVSEKKWVETSVKIGDYLPGIDARNFGMEEMDEAWEWLKK